MIYYKPEDFFRIVLRWDGSALNGTGPKRAFWMAMVALVVAALNDQYQFVVHTRDSTAFVDTLTVFNTFLGLIMSFRLNSAFQQWRAGVVAIGMISETARGIVAAGCSSVNAQPTKPTTTKSSDSDGTPGAKPKVAKATGNAGAERPVNSIAKETIEKCTFCLELRRLVFLYITIIFHECRGRDGIEKLKDSPILSEAEYDELFACGTEDSLAFEDQSDQARFKKQSLACLSSRTPHKLRATIVELWLRRLVDNFLYHGHFTAPIASYLHGRISQLPALYTTVYNIANVPIPFNYTQYLQFLITAYMTLYMFVIVPRSQYYTPLWVFFWGLFLFTADQIAVEIECPFGLDANDIDMEARLVQIEEELTVIVRSQYYYVSGGDNKIIAQTASLSSPAGMGPISVFDFFLGNTRQKAPLSDQPRDSLPEIDEYSTLILQHNNKEPLPSSQESDSSYKTF